MPNAVPSFAQFSQLFLFPITHQTQNKCRKIKCSKMRSEIHLYMQLSSAVSTGVSKTRSLELNAGCERGSTAVI